MLSKSTFSFSLARNIDAATCDDAYLTKLWLYHITAAFSHCVLLLTYEGQVGYSEAYFYYYHFSLWQ